MGINKGGRGKRIGERDRTSVLLEKNTLAKKKEEKARTLLFAGPS